MRTALAVLVALALPSPARADTRADVTAAFTAFVNAYAAPKPDLGTIELLMEPQSFEEEDLPVPAKLTQGLQQPKLAKLVRLVVSPGGTSAWVAAEISARVRGDKWKPETVRASAVLVLDGKAWRVTAAHFSVAMPEQPAPPGCGNASNQWEAPQKTPKALEPLVRQTMNAIGDAKQFAAAMSDSKDALLYGTSPGETFSGGAAIKKIFRKWHVSAWTAEDQPPHAVAGASPDGALVWLAVPIMAPTQMCSMYRGFFVLAKEPGGWKIVHQHYSLPYF
ncbi:MAG: nuclear transport factor 2 family protein [Acidobacteriota bacterium]